MRYRLLFLLLQLVAHGQENDDFHARCTKEGKTKIIDLRHGHMTMREYFSPERTA